MFKVNKMPTIKDPSASEWKPTNLSGGIVLTDLPMNLLDNQSPDMKNLWFKEKILTKRYGQEYTSKAVTALPILNFYDKLFNGFKIFTSSTNLYKMDSLGVVTLLYSSLTAAKGSFFTFKNKTTGVSILYYVNGHEYIQYDGTTVSTVQSHAYIPTVLLGRASTGGGTVLEQYNAIGAGFITSFSPNGTDKIFTLPQIALDATLVTITSLGVVKTEITDFTVARATGIITFITAPVLGTDTLKITAYKTDLVQLGYILASKYTITFGGDNDTRVFVAGDSTTYYYSGLIDPSYFPENQYNNAGNDSTFITGFGKMYDTLLVFKTNSLGVVTYSVNTDGSSPSFPYAQMNSVVGCDMPYTIQVVNNFPVWCNTYGGVYMLVSDTQIKDQLNVRPLSHNINGTIQRPALLQELKTNLLNAVTINFYGMYWLCVGSKVYAWDYLVSPFANSGNLDQDQINLSWFLFDSINANCLFGVDQDLYYGSLTGDIVHFINSYNDFGTAINAYWQSKINDFGLFEWFKYISDVRFDSKSDIFSTITTTYFSDAASRDDMKIDIVGRYRWNNFFWFNFTWMVTNYAKTFHKQPKLRNTVYFSVKFSNNQAGQNLSILNLAILLIQTKRVM